MIAWAAIDSNYAGTQTIKPESLVVLAGEEMANGIKSQFALGSGSKRTVKIGDMRILSLSSFLSMATHTVY